MSRVKERYNCHIHDTYVKKCNYCNGTTWITSHIKEVGIINEELLNNGNMENKNKLEFNIDYYDTKTWGYGPWNDEPACDYTERFEYEGYKCIIQRSVTTGAWCGYAIVDKEIKEVIEDLDVHGGITYEVDNNGMIEIGFDCSHGNDIKPLMDIRLRELRSLFKDEIFLYDTDGPLLKKLDELTNLMERSISYPKIKPHYWTINEVRNEIIRLVDQVIVIKNGK